jgi:hypothetical protein
MFDRTDADTCGGDPFAPLTQVEAGLRRFCADLDPDGLSPVQAAEGIGRLAALDRLSAGARLRLARRIDESVAGDEGEGSKARWLAKHTGQSPKDAEKDLATSESLDELEATDEALRNGELSPTQAHEVTSGAGADPSAELELLDTAKNASVPELKRKAKKVRAAATNAEEKAKRAEENRDFFSGVDEDEGEGWFHGKGPAMTIAELLALLEPWVQAEFDKVRRAGRRERRGALMFDALLTALRFAAACRNGKMTGRGSDGAPSSGPVGPPVRILVRVDAAALRRGHTVAGEICEIDGLGPVSIDDLRRLLPQAGIDVIITNGVDVFNVTHFGRRANARQQIVPRLDRRPVHPSRLWRHPPPAGRPPHRLGPHPPHRAPRPGLAVRPLSPPQDPRRLGAGDRNRPSPDGSAGGPGPPEERQCAARGFGRLIAAHR